MKRLTRANTKAALKPRSANSHKGNHGHALIVAGSMGSMGAAVIAARACMRSGVGLLTVNVPEEERFILQTAIPEAMLVRRENTAFDFNRFAAIGIGPGIGIDAVAINLLTDILEQSTKPLLLDADALKIIADHKTLLDKVPEQTILTPHPKEFERLFGIHKNAEDRTSTAIKKAKEHISKNNINQNTALKYIDIYAKNASDVKSPSKWVTEILIPVQSAVVVPTPTVVTPPILAPEVITD